MATKGAIAAQKAQAVERLAASMQTLSERLGVDPVTMGKRHRDPAYAQMQELDALAGWSERLVQALDNQPEPPGDGETDNEESTGDEHLPADEAETTTVPVENTPEEPATDESKPKRKAK